MNFYEQYILEREGLETINSDHGFISFRIHEGICFISDWWIRPESRGSKEGYKLADFVTEVAKKHDCRSLTCEVDTATVDCTRSLAAIIKYGFKIYQITDNRFIHLFKEVEHG